ncbi:MAG TPA: cytochrome c biogenesis protein CcdA [Chloroflexota bacterium]|nr:cytochrome c biogenesis protein CcdA [Chloroflexota bacterium]
MDQVTNFSALAALIAFAGGVLSFVSPCVLPLVPLYLGYLSGSAIGSSEVTATRRASLVNALFFVLGFSLVLVAIGATLGTLFQALLPAIRQAGGLVLVVFGLSMMGLFQLPWLSRRFSALSFERYRPGPGASLVVGMVFAAGWTPCIGPLLASILLLAGSAASWLQGTALLAFYSLGLGLPFIALAAGLAGLMPLIRGLKAHMRSVELVSGAFVTVVGLLVASNWLLRFTALLNSTPLARALAP